MALVLLAKAFSVSGVSALQSGTHYLATVLKKSDCFTSAYNEDKQGCALSMPTNRVCLIYANTYTADSIVTCGLIYIGFHWLVDNHIFLTTLVPKDLI